MAAGVAIRELDAGRPADLAIWAACAAALWSGETAAAHAAEIAATAGAERRAFAAFAPEGAAVGFAELGLRSYANGCESRPVPFLEGVWTAPDVRRSGAGRALIDHIGGLLRAAGHTEIGSDVLIDNAASLAAHAAWGFAEVERVVCLRKDL